MPPGARLVTRGSRWGNPYALLPDTSNRHAVVAQFRAYAEDRMRREPEWLAPLRGLDLACTCPLSEACHADVLLALAITGVDRDGPTPIPPQSQGECCSDPSE